MAPVNILIVDDREENIIALSALLERDDIRLFATTSPNEGLKIAWENQISIALIDVQMPGMDGFEFVEMLKSNLRTKDILVIFVTAISKETKYAVKGFDAGAIDYLYKPLDPAITQAKVDAFIQLARYQAEIKQKNEELQNMAVVVKNSADIICAVDAQTLLIQNINPAVEKIMGFNARELIGANILNFAIDDEKGPFEVKLKEIIKDKQSSSVSEFKFETFDNRIIWAECRVAYQNKMLFLNISDISAQKNFEAELIKSKENAEYGKKVKETFLANMSHELRTPVNGIIGLSDLLRKTPLNEQQVSMIDLLDVSSQSLLGVINDVLDISKMEAGKFKIVREANNLHELIRAVYGLLKFKADENNIEFLLDIDPEIPLNLMVDSLRLNQIMMNLLSNAIKFTKRGYVKLTVAVVGREENLINLKFSVEDSGIGIPENRLAAIFDSFEQAEDDTATKYGGTGLGLAIVKKLVELKGGELTVSSSEGEGSTFNFTNWYTVADKPKEKVVVKTERLLGQFENVSILVAEDNLVNQFMLAKMLKDWDVYFEMVDDGRKVLDRLKAKDFDLILMDTHMPELNGYETAKTIRRDFDSPKRNVPIISLSAAAFDHEQQEAISAGMNDWLSKPFQPHELHGKINELLKQAESVKSQV
ncbi:response regulator [Mucilaginibacter sp. BJC16-A38]|uniref:hybrid sensor histidine kinase/response regulator n=1 Tax=Mucilaginibacter phenanthrenivorans TaxID=1234842 RepID=UPI0021578FE3|nr:response regulator [Mucilaginibacter phenanthrenivorans]MCR8557085.1 response regulator [Mucilaginibacter phenanthrenivorans]